MDTNQIQLKKVMNLIAKVVDGHNLTIKESEDVFTNIFTHDTNGYHFSVFMAAIHAKGETSDELFGFYNSMKNLGIQINLDISPDKIIDLSGSGGGNFKSINVSTAASFIVASEGYAVPKESYYGVTSPTGSADLFSAFGMDIAKLNEEEICKALTNTGISPIFTTFLSPKLANRGKVSMKVFGEMQIAIRTPLHLVSNVYSPLTMNYRLYGCYSEKYLDIIAQLFEKIGFKKTITMYAKIGMPEFSNVGETVVVEQNGNSFKKYIVTAADFGAKKVKKEDIASGGKEQNIKDFIKIIKGIDKGPKADLVAMNAGAAFYLVGHAKDFKDGYAQAKSILNSGHAYKTLRKVTELIGSIENLDNWEKKALAEK